MSDSYKLTYFNGRGRAEVARLIFASAKQDFEDNRIEREAWPALKASSPMGQMPFLEHKGHTLCQSGAIARALAKKFNLNGETDGETARIDMYYCGIEDLQPKFAPIMKHMFGGTVGSQEARTAMDEIVKDSVVPFLEMYSKFLEKEGTGYLVGNKVSYVDLALFHSVDSLMVMEAGGKPYMSEDIITKNHPKIAEHHKKVAGLPGVKEYLAKRPVTPF